MVSPVTALPSARLMRTLLALVVATDENRPLLLL
jgi:hypothetical protein